MLAAIASLALAINQNAPITVDGELCHPRNLMVKYQNAAALQSLEQRAHVIRVMPEIHYAVVESQPGTLKLARRLIASWPGVQRVELDRCAKPAYDPNDPTWPDQWDMRAIRTNYAWDTQRGDPSVIVAVIDTGVFVGHPDLAPNIWVNTGEIPNNGIDDDGDGYIDDVNGYDFSHNDGNPDDVYGHGTACAGIVAAAQDNNIGVSGVAPYCRIMALKAATDSGYFYDSNDVPAYLYAANHGAKVLSMSFFCDQVSQSERDAMDYCWDHGVLPVAASGNSASIYPYYPGGYEHVLSVAAVDGNLNKAGFSDYGSWVDVSAPGVSINTTTNDGGYTSGFAGTSGACPHVAGVAALCFSANLGATNEQVREAIEDTATMQSQAPYGEFANYGLVNAEAAVLRMNGGASGTHPPVVRYVTRHAQNVRLNGPNLHVVSRIYGRGFGDLNSLSLTSGGNPIPIIANGRDWIDFNSVSTPFGFDLSVSGNPVAHIAFPPSTTTSCMLVEASSQGGATLTGGFGEALAVDSQFIRCQQMGDNSILVQATFRKVTPSTTMKLVLRRQYTGTTAGTENVQLYDWSSASYPYGNFVSVGGGACPTSMTTSTFAVPNASRFVDPEGTVYLLITTSTDLSSGAELHIDMAHLDG